MNKGDKITATVPGNLLVGGEYIILEEGGLGIAMAAGPDAQASAWPSAGKWSSIHVITDEGAISLNTAMKLPKMPLIIQVYQALVLNMQQRGYPPPPPLEIEINTASFFSNGRKRGLGSSAAATVLLTGLIFAWALPREDLNKEVIANAAVVAHHQTQKEKGSGYDIITSCYGLAGIFTGGNKPQWSVLNSDHPLFLVKLYTFAGPQEVDSRQAVKRYQQWRSQHSEEAAQFFTRSQELLYGLQNSRNEEHFLRRITELRLLSTELGEQIGVESWISPPTAFYERSAWKGSGAGNELGMLFLSNNSKSQLSTDYTQVKIHSSGLCLSNAQGDVLLG